MFNKIPTVLRSQEIIDKSFSKASKIEEPYFPKKEDKIRKDVIDRISTIESIACAHLDKIVKKFPSIERIHPFYRDLVDLMFDIDKYKQSLGKIQWTSEKIVLLSTDLIRKLKFTHEIPVMNSLMRQYYGRFSSLIKEIDRDLIFLGECRDYMRKIPDIDPELKTFIIAGMPNVGKSSLIAAITNTKPQIASYPFTTQSISIGYLDIDHEKIQLIDTPGILDRPMSERNEMELKAVMALKDINGVIVFLFDGSGFSGYSYEQQESLFKEVSRMFLKPVIRVQSKIDIPQNRREELGISIQTGEGLEELRKVMSKTKIGVKV